MLKRIFTIILVLTTFNVNAQKIDLISVSGKVLTDAQEPVSDAQVMVNDSVVSVTDTSGLFSFRIRPESFYIKAVKDGYESEWGTVIIVAIFLVLLLVVCFMPYPHSQGESILQHIIFNNLISATQLYTDFFVIREKVYFLQV